MGFTLVEMTIAITITSILLVAIGSTIILASHALPDRDSPATLASNAAVLTDQLTSELQSAIFITERTDSAITFTVADRDGDGNVEKLRYAWSGAAGDPLTRSYNDGPESVVLENISSLQFTYNIETISDTYPGPPVELENIYMLSGYIGDMGTIENFVVDPDNWAGLFFRPALPEGTISWRITDVWLLAKRAGVVNAQTLLQVRTADGDYLPTETIVEQKLLNEVDLEANYNWEYFSFGNASFIPGQGLCFTVVNESSSPSVKWAYDFDTVNTTALDTEDAGQEWDQNDDQFGYHYIYGKRTVAGSDRAIQREYVTAVGIDIHPADTKNTWPITTTVRTVNEPEVLAAFWETDFGSDPRHIDINTDGLPDWSTEGISPFNPFPASNGIWRGRGTLLTNPQTDFSGPVIVEMRFRATIAAGIAARIEIDSPVAGGQMWSIGATLELLAEQSQKLTVFGKTSMIDEVTLHSTYGLSDDFITLKLLIHPDDRIVNVKINGRSRGTYNFAQYAEASQPGRVKISATQNMVEIDYISVRAGEQQ